MSEKKNDLGSSIEELSKKLKNLKSSPLKTKKFLKIFLNNIPKKASALLVQENGSFQIPKGRKPYNYLFRLITDRLLPKNKEETSVDIWALPFLPPLDIRINKKISAEQLLDSNTLIKLLSTEINKKMDNDLESNSPGISYTIAELSNNYMLCFFLFFKNTKTPLVLLLSYANDFYSILSKNISNFLFYYDKTSEQPFKFLWSRPVWCIMGWQEFLKLLHLITIKPL